MNTQRTQITEVMSIRNYALISTQVEIGKYGMYPVLINMEYFSENSTSQSEGV